MSTIHSIACHCCLLPLLPVLVRSGVLDVAAAIVQLLRRFFAEQIDDLKPEQYWKEIKVNDTFQRRSAERLAPFTER